MTALAHVEVSGTGWDMAVVGAQVHLTIDARIDGAYAAWLAATADRMHHAYWVGDAGWSDENFDYYTFSCEPDE